MNPSTTLIYAVFTILLVPLGGVTLLVVLRLLRNRNRVRDLAITRVLLGVIGSSLLLVSVGGLAAVSAWGLHSDDGPGLLSAGLLADSMMFCLLATIGWAGFRSLQLSRNVQADIAGIDLLDFEERLSGLQLIGWSLAALPLLFVAPLLIPILMIPFAFMEGPASSRRSKQCHLLWLLAIAVKQAQPLPPLLESYAVFALAIQPFSQNIPIPNPRSQPGRPFTGRCAASRCRRRQPRATASLQRDRHTCRIRLRLFAGIAQTNSPPPLAISPAHRSHFRRHDLLCLLRHHHDPGVQPVPVLDARCRASLAASLQ